MADERTESEAHQALGAADQQERFTLELFDHLWDRYRQRVDSVRTYQQLLREHGADFASDHIAFRTFASQQPTTGIATVSRVFEALGYRPAGCYHFPEKHLNAIHYQHPRSDFPKLFISELRIWELPQQAREIIERSLKSHRPPISAEHLAALAGLSNQESDLDVRRLMETVLSPFHELPWDWPEKQDVLQLYEVSQYAAWVLVHGYHVNHFTGLVNAHGAAGLEDIEKTASALQQAGLEAASDGHRGGHHRGADRRGRPADHHALVLRLLRVG